MFQTILTFMQFFEISAPPPLENPESTHITTILSSIFISDTNLAFYDPCAHALVVFISSCPWYIYLYPNTVSLSSSNASLCLHTLRPHATYLSYLYLSRCLYALIMPTRSLSNLNLPFTSIIKTVKISKTIGRERISGIPFKQLSKG